MLRKIVLVLGLASLSLTAVTGSTKPQTDSGQEVDKVVEAQRVAQKIPGVSVAVCRRGKIVKAGGYGLANVELNVAAAPETIYQTGSVGKQFAAMAVMMLVEEGKLSLNDKISKYINDTPPAWSGITVRHLLTHTSGIPDYAGDVGPLGNQVIDLRRDYTEEQLVAAFTKMPMDFAPGEKWSYSNTGYALLGFIIRRVTGEFYGDVLQQRIFHPLGMTSTRIISEADIVPNRSSGYRLVDGQLKNQEWVSPTLNTTADGALYTNVLDMAKWDAALDARKLLKQSSYDAMWSPVKLNNGKTYPYGFGWFLSDENGKKVVSHDGAWQGFTMNITRHLDERLTVIVMTNLDSDHSHPEKIAEDVAKIYLK